MMRRKQTARVADPVRGLVVGGVVVVVVVVAADDAADPVVVVVVVAAAAPDAAGPGAVPEVGHPACALGEEVWTWILTWHRTGS